jgi:glyoxylase-like metal-dependent hydrolase (beta-lactamase superfamily II)
VRVNEEFYIVPVTFHGHLGSMVLNLSLIVLPDFGATLVDASMPSHLAEVQAALAADGFSPGDVRQIIVTHHDIDHIGSLAQIAAATGAKILAHPAEAPYIAGTKKMVKYPSEDALAQDPRRKEVFDQIGFAPVDQLIEDGEIIGGGIRVVATPGHSPGHISLLVEGSKILIAGDALTSENGRLAGPGVRATPDMPTATKSVRRLAGLPELTAIVTYHGGLVTDDPLGQLRRVADEMEAAESTDSQGAIS